MPHRQKALAGTTTKKNCAAPDRIEGCTYLITMNDGFVENVLLKHQSLPRFGIREWFGYADIGVADGVVARYSFWVWYKASNGHWRGIGSGTSPALPKYEPVQANISDSYSVRRIDFKSEVGSGLASALTPTATANERQRALHIDFGCLSQGAGCGEICEVMPEAWRDFYDKLGHVYVDKLGEAYLFCSQLPR